VVVRKEWNSPAEATFSRLFLADSLYAITHWSRLVTSAWLLLNNPDFSRKEGKAVKGIFHTYILVVHSKNVVQTDFTESSFALLKWTAQKSEVCSQCFIRFALQSLSKSKFHSQTSNTEVYIVHISPTVYGHQHPIFVFR